ncbi:hypothetical protein LSAT2_029495 [Lamellibrachia satsuma]|nr:hypothetical protein LSAT2_029495 [Lamellibrachia satsuma]
MDMGAVGQFPHPIPAAHCGSRREMFTDYGSLVAVSVQMGSTITQKLHRYDVLHRLYASRPSLPLFPSHYVREPHSDLCVGELQRRRERTVYALSTMGYIKSLVKKDTEQQQNLKMYLFNLECGSGLAEREEGDDGSDDCQSLGYPVLPILADILHEQIGNGTDLHSTTQHKYRMDMGVCGGGKRSTCPQIWY